MTLHKNFSIIDETKERIHSIPELKGATITAKFNDLSNKNKGLEIL